MSKKEVEVRDIVKGGFQGDCALIRVESMPDDVVPAKQVNGQYIVAHSETGHNHAVEQTTCELFESANDPLIAYLVVKKITELKHYRDYKTHKTLRMRQPGIYRVHRQREGSKELFRRVVD